MVSLLAVTETFLGYGESEDFPFSERLPLSSLRPNHKQLLQRGLRDAEYRIAWHRCIEKVEAKVDLGVWASGHTGLSFGFPHLSRLRLQQTYEAFESAAVKESSTADFFASHAESIAKEVEFAKASAQGGAVWLLLRDLSVFIDDCAGGIEKTQGAKGMADIVRVYIDAASRIEWRHIELRRGAEEEGRPSVARVADRAMPHTPSPSTTPSSTRSHRSEVSKARVYAASLRASMPSYGTRMAGERSLSSMPSVTIAHSPCAIGLAETSWKWSP